MQGAMQSQLWRTQVTGASLHVTSTTTRVQVPERSVRASAEREVKAKAVAEPPASIAEDRLVARVEEKDGYWVLKEAYQQSLNPAEKVRPAFISRTQIEFPISSCPCQFGVFKRSECVWKK